MRRRVANIRQAVAHMSPVRRMANVRQAAARISSTCKRLSMFPRDGMQRESDALLAKSRR